MSQWLAAAARAAGSHGSICNGVFILGYAGLLDRKTVTTHWNDTSTLADMFPLTNVNADQIDGRDRGLYTSAAVMAGINLCLFLLAEDFGAKRSLNVAKRLVVHIQRNGGQSQFSRYLTPHAENDSVVAALGRFVMANLGHQSHVGNTRPIRLDESAEFRAAVCERCPDDAGAIHRVHPD